MATQDDSGVPFSIAREQQNFRLLELPDELVQLLSSENAPTLELKPAPTSDPSKPGHAVLATSDKIYEIRQVQTSNSVLLVQPSKSQNEDGIPVPGVAAIATISTTLELLPSKPPSTAKETLGRKWHEKFKASRK